MRDVQEKKHLPVQELAKRFERKSVHSDITFKEEKDDNFVSSLESQCEALKREVKALNRKYEKREKERAEEDKEIIATMRMMRDHIQRLEVENESLVEKCEKMQSSKYEKAGKKRELEGEIRKKIDGLKKTNGLSARVEELKDENQKMKNEMTSRVDQISTLSKEKKSLTSKCQELQEEQERLQAKCLCLQQAADVMTKEEDDLKSKIKELESNREFRQAIDRRRIATLEKELEEALSTESSLPALEGLESRLQASEARCTAQEETISQLEMQLDAALSSAVAGMPSVHNLKDQVREGNDRLDFQEEEIQKLEAKLEDANRTIDDMPLIDRLETELKESHDLCASQEQRIEELEGQLSATLSAMADDIQAVQSDMQTSDSSEKAKIIVDDMPLINELQDRLKVSHERCSKQEEEIQKLQERLSVALSAMADDIPAIKEGLNETLETEDCSDACSSNSSGRFTTMNDDGDDIDKFNNERNGSFNRSLGSDALSYLSLLEAIGSDEESEHQPFEDSVSDVISANGDGLFNDKIDDAMLDRALQPILSRSSSATSSPSIDEDENDEDDGIEEEGDHQEGLESKLTKSQDWTADSSSIPEPHRGTTRSDNTSVVSGSSSVPQEEQQEKPRQKYQAPQHAAVEEDGNFYVSMDEMQKYIQSLANTNDSKTRALLSQEEARDEPSMRESRTPSPQLGGRDSISRSVSSRPSVDTKESSEYGGHEYVFAKPTTSTSSKQQQQVSKSQNGSNVVFFDRESEMIDARLDILDEMKKASASKWTKKIFRKTSFDRAETKAKDNDNKATGKGDTETSLDGVWC